MYGCCKGSDEYGSAGYDQTQSMIPAQSTLCPRCLTFWFLALAALILVLHMRKGK